MCMKRQIKDLINFLDCSDLLSNFINMMVCRYEQG